MVINHQGLPPPTSLIFTGIRRRTSYSILSAFLVRGTKTQPVLWACRRTRRPNSSLPRDQNVSICPKHQHPHPHGQPQSHRHPTAPPGQAQESVHRVCCNPPGLRAPMGTTSHGQRGAGPPERLLGKLSQPTGQGFWGDPAANGQPAGGHARAAGPTTATPPPASHPGGTPPAAAPGERWGEGPLRSSPTREAMAHGHGAWAAWKPLGQGGQSLTARGFLLAKPVTNVFAREQTASQRAQTTSGTEQPLPRPSPACHASGEHHNPSSGLFYRNVSAQPLIGCIL